MKITKVIQNGFQLTIRNKKRFSSNWKKVKARITKCHENIGNARKDYLHKVSTEVCDIFVSHNFIYLMKPVH